MRVIVIGGGGREHAIVQKLKENKKIDKLFVLPGNGGMDVECVQIKATDIKSIVTFSIENKIDFAVVTPDDPLALGCVDELESVGIKCFGPRKNAAVIESSKVFAKELMKKYGIPTSAYEVFDDISEAKKYLERTKPPYVIKADGLALGKGVIIAANRKQAETALDEMMCDKIFGESGSRVVIEEYLTGEEVSVLAFTDGKTIIPLPSSMDHKRAFDNDEGLNTGGMGAIAPNPYYTEAIGKECMEKIFIPTINAMNSEGRMFKGCLYFGLMITPEGPKVIEYNCRFGDPETQAVLPLLKSDLLDIMIAVSEEKLATADVRFYKKASCCVVMASCGYPVKYQTGFEISLPQIDEDERIYFAGVKRNGDKLITSGGRVLGAVCVNPSLRKAISGAYKIVKKIDFENAFYRSDIGKKALAAEE